MQSASSTAKMYQARAFISPCNKAVQNDELINITASKKLRTAQLGL